MRNTFASTAMASKASFNPSSTAVTQRVVSFINGAGHRAVAVGLDRPASTVLRWLRDAHAEWLYQQGGQKSWPSFGIWDSAGPAARLRSGGLNTRVSAAVTYRQVLGLTPLWWLIGSFIYGQLIAPNRRT